MTSPIQAELDQSIISVAGDLEALQKAVVLLLTRHPALSAAKIGHEDEGDIENVIASAFAESGLMLLVMSPEGRSDSPDAASLHLDDLEIRIRIIEVPLINRGDSGTRIPINRAVQMVATYLRNCIIGGHALSFQRFEPDPKAETPTKDVIFKTALTLSNM
jgi:hypothetical protein